MKFLKWAITASLTLAIIGFVLIIGDGDATDYYDVWWIVTVLATLFYIHYEPKGGETK